MEKQVKPWGARALSGLAVVGVLLVLLPDLLELAHKIFTVEVLVSWAGGLVKEIGVAMLIAVAIVVIVEIPKHRRLQVMEENFLRTVRNEFAEHRSSDRSMLDHKLAELSSAIVPTRIPSDLSRATMEILRNGVYRSDLTLTATFLSVDAWHATLQLKWTFVVFNKGVRDAELEILESPAAGRDQLIRADAEVKVQPDAKWKGVEGRTVYLSAGSAQEIIVTTEEQVRKRGTYMITNRYLSEGISIELKGQDLATASAQLSFDAAPQIESGKRQWRWVSRTPLHPGHAIAISWSLDNERADGFSARRP